MSFPTTNFGFLSICATSMNHEVGSASEEVHNSRRLNKNVCIQCIDLMMLTKIEKEFEYICAHIFPNTRLHGWYKGYLGV